MDKYEFVEDRRKIKEPADGFVHEVVVTKGTNGDEVTWTVKIGGEEFSDEVFEKAFEYYWHYRHPNDSLHGDANEYDIKKLRERYVEFKEYLYAERKVATVHDQYVAMETLDQIIGAYANMFGRTTSDWKKKFKKEEEE